MGSHLNPLSQAPGSASSGRLWVIPPRPPQPPGLCTGQQAAFKSVCASATFLHGQGPSGPLAHLLCSTPPSTPFSVLRSPLQAGHLLTKASLGHTPVCGLTSTHFHVCQITPFPAKPSFTPPLVKVISLSWSTHVLWGPFHSRPELQSSHWG